MSGIQPVWRAIFSIIWFYDLARKLFTQAAKVGYQSKYSAGPLAFTYVVASLIANAPPPFWLFSFVSVLTFIPLFQANNAYLKGTQESTHYDHKYSGRQLALIIVGGIIIILAIIGSFTTI